MFTETNDQVNGYKMKIIDIKTELLEANVTEIFL
jgi:hypothetical protein